ncbi:EAL domain-containing protein [Pseudomonas sp.]|uniref:EAL domain-containing protein n=1 Tax=Pseudomonas sp. TaxID=306 RepID=UPI00326607E3
MVAEGVETTEQAQILRELNVDLLQGFLYARPMPAEQLETLLNMGGNTQHEELIKDNVTVFLRSLSTSI